jgi:hypothetical protein
VSARNILIAVYTLAIIGGLMVWLFLIRLHGYRQWWLMTFYAGFAGAVIAGCVSRHDLARRNRKR